MKNRRIVCSLLICALALCSCTKASEATESESSIAETTTSSITKETTQGTSETTDSEDHPSGFVLKDVEDRMTAAEDFTSSEQWVRVIDDFIYADGTTTDMIKAYQECPVFAEGDCSDNVTRDIELPLQIGDVTLKWKSSDESIISNDGKVTLPHEHSKYVLLTATIEKDGKTAEAAYVVRVARDMFADIGTDKILPLDSYNEIWAFEAIGIDTDNWDYPGWFYEYDEPGQLYFFEDIIDDLTIYDDSTAAIADYFISGTLVEPTIETAHESYLMFYSMRKILGWKDNSEMRFEGIMGDGYTVIYDYAQYYNGVPTRGWAKIIIGPYAGINMVHSWILQIPDGFDEKPSVSEEEVSSEYNITNLTLEITEYNGEIKLVWSGYSTDSPEYVIVDAKTGEELSRGSTVVT